MSTEWMVDYDALNDKCFLERVRNLWHKPLKLEVIYGTGLHGGGGGADTPVQPPEGKATSGDETPGRL